ncbi:hypothetical protein TRIUR3_29299 [Triticum urartu]|uniref:CCHC-type domain-containing protein n=1 Tax=Triticum urartu TaxID=4572 RepID=M8AV07_TRIUA|nr:hypothetical protein TRIUR3_29299 [Triticum urartu]
MEDAGLDFLLDAVDRCEGHKRTTCPDQGDAAKKRRRPGKCKKCGMKGHRRNTCTRPLGGVQNQNC